MPQPGSRTDTTSMSSPTLRNRTLRARRICVGAALALALSVSGCGISIPADPEGTLDSVSGGTLRVGVSVDPPLTEVHGTEPTGPMVDLAASFAEHIDATPTWTVHGEETLVKLMEQGEIDLAVGAFTDQSPWSDRVGLTRGYAIPGFEPDSFVMLVPIGENAMLTSLERFLDTELGA